MLVYRITKRRRAEDLSGTGAAIFPGRWNRAGVPVLYTGESIEIALLETIVHMKGEFVPDLSIITLEIPGRSVMKLLPEQLPKTWFHNPAPAYLSEIAQKWINAGKHLALKVPSSIVHSSFNYVLNCHHSRYSEVSIKSIEPFYFDHRLVEH